MYDCYEVDYNTRVEVDVAELFAELKATVSNKQSAVDYIQFLLQIRSLISAEIETAGKYLISSLKNNVPH